MAGVAVLRFYRCPAYVARFIVAVVVDAIKCIARFATMREYGNIVMKSHEVVSPLIADSDAAVTVSSVVLALRIGTARDYARPNAVKRGCCHSMRSTAMPIYFQATTRPGITINQVRCCCNGSRSTIALTEPKNLCVSVTRHRFNRDKFAKTLARYVFASTGEDDRLGLHQKFLFWCHTLGRFQPSPGCFVLATTRVIVAYLSHNHNACPGCGVRLGYADRSD